MSEAGPAPAPLSSTPGPRPADLKAALDATITSTAWADIQTGELERAIRRMEEVRRESEAASKAADAAVTKLRQLTGYADVWWDGDKLWRVDNREKYSRIKLLTAFTITPPKEVPPAVDQPAQADTEANPKG